MGEEEEMRKPKTGPWRADIKTLCVFGCVYMHKCVCLRVYACVSECTGPGERLLNSISAGRTKEDGWRIPSQR